MPQPSASTMSLNSWLARILSAEALATLRILPRNGRIAWVSRSRACLAEPPALSPSTRKISVPAALSRLHSASLPLSRTLRSQLDLRTYAEEEIFDQGGGCQQQHNDDQQTNQVHGPHHPAAHHVIHHHSVTSPDQQPSRPSRQFSLAELDAAGRFRPAAPWRNY